MRKSKDLKDPVKRFAFRQELKLIFMLTHPNTGMKRDVGEPAAEPAADEGSQASEEASWSNSRDLNWQPSKWEAGTALRDSEIDFGPVGDAINRAQITPWQASLLLEAYNGVMAGRTITPEICQLTERKLRGEVRRTGERALQGLQGQQVHAAYFDGKINTHLTAEDGRLREKRDENISVVVYGGPEEEERYVGYAVAENGTGIAVASSVLNHLDEYQLAWQGELRMVGADATNSNTGGRNGALALLQTMSRRTLQWNICLLHHNELPLRHLFGLVGIVTKSGAALTGPPGSFNIGELLTTPVWERPVGEYEIIEVELPELSEEQIRGLSNDARYLYLICRAVTRGKRSRWNQGSKH